MDDDLTGDEREQARDVEQRQQFHEQYGDVGIAVLDILIRYDPAFIIRASAPPVQYTIEAGPICQRLPEANSPEDVARTVYEVMATKFSEKIANRETRYRQMGQEIWEAWTRKGRG